MLRELHIRNFALIDRIDMEFGSGFNLLTGETGAGKSILIDALGLALGARGSADCVRTGADRAVVEALFDLADASESTIKKLSEYELSDDDNEAVAVSREISKSGKSVCRVNGRLASVNMLREIAADLIDIHGQHEHQSLLAAENHILLLDNWLGDEALALRSNVATAFADLLGLRKELEGLRTEARERIRNLDLYSYQRTEIEAARLLPDEDDELAAERSRLANSGKLRATADDAYGALTESGLEGLQTALSTVERSVGLDPDLEPIRSSLMDAISFAEDACRDLRRYRDRIEANPERLEEIEDRLSLIQLLKRKYGDSIEQVLVFLTDLTDKIAGIENQEIREADIYSRIQSSELKLGQLAGDLSDLRRQASKRFSKAITENLIDLGMGAAVFEIRMDKAQVTARGIDDVEFLISANPGEAVRPLAKVASGGELSRLMLAMKSVLAQAAYMPTLIFDEIDVGVGGRTAAVIADKLRSLAESAQVVCITHLPQIASRPATTHYLIEKAESALRTTVSVRKLTDDARIDEIVRMLGGAHDSDTARRHAREMLTVA